MKFNKISFLALAAAFAFTACEDEHEYTPGEMEPANGYDVYFAKGEQSAVYEVDPSDPTAFDFKVYRPKELSAEALEMPLEISVNDNDVFQVPATAQFAAGDTAAVVHVEYPNAEEGVTYNLLVNVPQAYWPVYKDGAGTNVSFKAKVTRIKWESIGYCYWVDGIILSFFGVDVIPMAVETEKAVLGSEVRYRFNSPYASKCNSVYDIDSKTVVSFDDPAIDDVEHYAYIGYPYNNSMGTLTGVVDKMVVRVTNGGCILNQFALGSDWGYDAWICGTIYELTGNNSAPLGKLDKGTNVITFPEKSLYLYFAHPSGTGAYTLGEASYFVMSDESLIEMMYPENELNYAPIMQGVYTHGVADLIDGGILWGGKDEDGNVIPYSTEATLYQAQEDDSQYCIDPWLNSTLFFTMTSNGEIVVDDCTTGVSDGTSDIFATNFALISENAPMSYFDSENFTLNFYLAWHNGTDLYAVTQDEFQITGTIGNESKVRGRKNGRLRHTDFKFNKPKFRKDPKVNSKLQPFSLIVK